MVLLSQDVLNLTKIEPLTKLFIQKLRTEIKNYLKQHKHYTTAEIKLFMQKEFKSLKVTQIQKSKVLHFHFLFNLNLLKIFGYEQRLMFQKKN
ncbi:MAG: hypothetical protein Q8784_02300 [Vigna little leaf phytoplasma]|nr:hypothetical protein [Vigna little leaf phytoplasma]